MSVPYCVPLYINEYVKLAGGPGGSDQQRAGDLFPELNVVAVHPKVIKVCHFTPE